MTLYDLILARHLANLHHWAEVRAFLDDPWGVGTGRPLASSRALYEAERAVVLHPDYPRWTW